MYAAGESFPLSRFPAPVAHVATAKDALPCIEILKSTMRTREYIERGEGEGKTLLDAMRDGDKRRYAAFRWRNREVPAPRHH